MENERHKTCAYVKEARGASAVVGAGCPSFDKTGGAVNWVLAGICGRCLEYKNKGGM